MNPVVRRKPGRIVKVIPPAMTFDALDFFAGSGLVSTALHPFFDVVWANDIDSRKAAIYRANHSRGKFVEDDICRLDGSKLPSAALSWASFPCQDLSLAGKQNGLDGPRSGLVWEWLRVMDEMRRAPRLIVAENVNGLITSENGSHYKKIHEALVARGYRVGAIILDGRMWVPQSRVRVFIVAVQKKLRIPARVTSDSPNWAHSDSLVKAARGLEEWVWWHLPQPRNRPKRIEDIIELDVEMHSSVLSKQNVKLIPERHIERLNASDHGIATGYKRVRNGHQVLELRFDGLAGCLRTSRGGSSRQYVAIRTETGIRTRLLTISEAAALMGVPTDYRLPTAYNDAYTALGDAVVVPAVRFLARHLLWEILRG
jgi:DNA (cytosine-5)-methyltransferase 1